VVQATYPDQTQHLFPTDPREAGTAQLVMRMCDEWCVPWVVCTAQAWQAWLKPAVLLAAAHHQPFPARVPHLLLAVRQAASGRNGDQAPARRLLRRLYALVVHNRWTVDRNFWGNTVPKYFGAMPWLQRTLLIWLIRPNYIKRAYLQGWGRWSGAAGTSWGGLTGVRA